MRVGVDIASISQMAHSLRVSQTFAAAIFTASERSHAVQMPSRRAAEFLAGRFAAKEAVLKALHLEIDDPTKMREIEVIASTGGEPTLYLSGSVARVATDMGTTNSQVSISHDAGMAVAFVLLS